MTIAPQTGEVFWRPAPDALERTEMGRYLSWARSNLGIAATDFWPLWEWSVEDLGGFWRSLVDYFGVRVTNVPDEPFVDRGMPDVDWFPGMELNYAEHLLSQPAEDAAITSVSQTRDPVTLTFGELREQVARCRVGLQRMGVVRGDRVAAYLPNIVETVIAMLASASLGAIFTSCAPEFGLRSVIDRFSQVEPKVLLAIDGYRFGDQPIDRRANLAGIIEALPSLEHTVLLPYLHSERQGDPDRDGLAQLTRLSSWAELVAEPGELSFESVPFDHPLYVLYSSGTTGLPKAIVHGHGPMLLEHLKTLALQEDMRRGDTVFFFCTTGWMMWNWLISALGLGAHVLLFDGNPTSPDLGTLWRLVGKYGLSFLGVSAQFLHSCHKAELNLAAFDLGTLRTIQATGSPLSPQTLRWCYDTLPDGVQVGALSGGTDVCSAFVASNPLLPVRAEVLSGPCLGVKAEAFDKRGRSVVGEEGELVITKPMPSMPVGFWGDPSGARYRTTYFEHFPGVWRHGDWVTITPDRAYVISGRSDATLNRAGVRLGTGELYAAVETVPEVTDSLVVHLDKEGAAGHLLMFLVLADGVAGGVDLARSVRTTIRTGSPTCRRSRATSPAKSWRCPSSDCCRALAATP